MHMCKSLSRLVHSLIFVVFFIVKFFNPSLSVIEKNQANNNKVTGDLKKHINTLDLTVIEPFLQQLDVIHSSQSHVKLLQELTTY